MERIRSLGLALVALGMVELAWVAFCVFGGLILGLAGFADQHFGAIAWIGGAAYGLLALGNLPIAVLHLVAGTRLRQGRGLILAVAALATCLVSTIFALYCSPFALFVLVYGIVVLSNPETRRILDPPPDGARTI